MAVVLRTCEHWGRYIEDLPGFLHDRLNTAEVATASIAEFREMFYFYIWVIAVFQSASGMAILPAGLSTGTLQ